MTDAYDIQLAQAACTLVQQITPSLLPQTTLDITAAVGAATLTAPTGTNLLGLGFRPGGIVSFYDELGEQPLAIPEGGINGNVLTLDFSGQPYAGLQFAHPVGAIVASNLLDSPPIDTVAMRRGAPVISCFVLDEDLSIRATQVYDADIKPLQIVYQLDAIQPPTNTMNTQLWSRQQVHRGVNDVAMIVTAIINNHRFNVTNAGPLAQSVPNLHKSLRRVIESDSIRFYELTLEVYVKGGMVSFTP